MLGGGSSGLGNFQFRLNEKNEKDLNIYTVEIKGNIGVPSAGYLFARTTLFDITHNTNKLVISLYDKLQYEDSTIFLIFINSAFLAFAKIGLKGIF